MSFRSAWVALACLLLSCGSVAAQDPNLCDVPGEAPDIIVGDLNGITVWGNSSGTLAVSVGTTSCNVGTCWADWLGDFGPGNESRHPVIGQNMFRLKDGRFEQIGQSWLKHGFSTFDQNLCGTCIPGDGQHLGVNCSDPYNSGLNGQQSVLGPKFEINPATGEHQHPVTDIDATGDVLFKRLQAAHADIDPLLNPGALYWVEAQYVTADDAAAGNKDNNASYRKVVVTGSSPGFGLSFDGSTQQEQAAIRVWKELDPGVELLDVDIPGDGRITVGARVTDLGSGLWHYEYAVHNDTSHRAAREFSVPIPPGASVSNVGFHDVDYHSGEPIEGKDWTPIVGADSVTWSTETFAANPQANSLRWGTVYNFRFDADVPPAAAGLGIGLWRPGSPDAVAITLVGPRVCNSNGSCDAGETSCSCPLDCGAPDATESACGDLVDNDCNGFADCLESVCCGVGACLGEDNDSDLVPNCSDCNDGNGQVWQTPSETLGLTLARVPTGALLTWSPPQLPGATANGYDVLRSRAPDEFVLATTCLAPLGTSVVDVAFPLVNQGFYYLIRATNVCPDGDGPLGVGSDGETRLGRDCQ